MSNVFHLLNGRVGMGVYYIGPLQRFYKPDILPCVIEASSTPATTIIT